MALKQQIESDLKTALLGGDKFRSDVLRGLKAVILNEEVAKGLRDSGLEDSQVEQLIVREVKKRADSASQYLAAGRPELSEAEINESKVLEGYLPKQLSEAEIKQVVAEIITSTGASGPQAMGQTMGAVKAKLGSSADGSVIAKIVKEALGI